MTASSSRLLKAHGFRWSARLQAWYLPRTWHENTRDQRVCALQAVLGDQLTVDRSDAPRSSAAQRDDLKRSRAAARADLLARRAAVAEERAAAAGESARRRLDGIPLGHHSQRRHERDLERIDRDYRTARDQEQAAEEAHAAAQRARRAAEGQESTVTIGNRVERNQAESRRLTRRLDGIGKRVHGQDSPATGTYRSQLQTRPNSPQPGE